MSQDKNTSSIEIMEYYDINEEELYDNKNTIPTSAYAIIMNIIRQMEIF